LGEWERVKEGKGACGEEGAGRSRGRRGSDSMVKHGQIWANMVKHGEQWSKMVKYGPTWSNMAQHASDDGRQAGRGVGGTQTRTAGREGVGGGRMVDGRRSARRGACRQGNGGGRDLPGLRAGKARRADGGGRDLPPSTPPPASYTPGADGPLALLFTSARLSTHSRPPPPLSHPLLPRTLHLLISSSLSATLLLCITALTDPQNDTQGLGALGMGVR
jgi:hypothetical protein